MKIFIGPPGTPPPNVVEGGNYYTVNDSGVTPWKMVLEQEDIPTVAQIVEILTDDDGGETR